MEGFGTSFADAKATAANANGTVVAGHLYTYLPDDFCALFLWTPAGGFETIANPVGCNRVESTGLSGDVNRMVGYMWPNVTNTSEAIIWTRQSGVVRLRDYLQAKGANVLGWQLRYATTSDDGRFICGTGFNELTQTN